MYDLMHYIEEYGDYTFEEEKFNEIDALLFSQLAYVNYSAIVCKFDSDVETDLQEVSRQFFYLYNDDDIKDEISIVYKACMLLKQCAKKKRYKNVKMLKFANNVNDKIDKQFSAVSFYLNDKIDVIAFRGTDTTITGIKESAMLSYMFPVPAQIEGLYYFQESAMLSNRDIIICGHSKGGNLATFAGVNCSNSLKKRIIGIYEFDAPGFPKEMIERYDYIHMKNRIFSYIPSRSIIGCMLYHNTSLKIVSSTNENLKQHQVSSWQIEKNHFIFVNETDAVSKFIDKYIKELCETVGEDNIEDVFETIFDFLEDTGIKEYDDIKNFDITKLIKAMQSIKNIDSAKRENIENTIKHAIKELSVLIYEQKLKTVAIPKLKTDRIINQ